jgi:uncharacterized protein
MRRVDIVCVTSKLCNLRCRYCDEYPLLGDKRTMRLDQVERMFENIETHFRRRETPLRLHFQWYGGEPLIIEPDVYRKFFEIQQRVFSGSIHRITNGVQSNFTLIDNDRIALLRDSFDVVGVSLDLFTGLRVDASGRCQESRIIGNLDRVSAAGVRTSGITVLSRPNLHRIPDIYAFYRKRGMTFRLLGLEKGLYEPGQDFEITPRETLEAFTTLADLWLADETLLAVQPVDRYFSLLLHSRSHPESKLATYDRARPSVLIVDTNGSLYHYGERFDTSLIAGNIFENRLDQILTSPHYIDSIRRSRLRIDATCGGCSYFGRACSGDPIGEGQQDFIEHDERGHVRCIVARGLIEHLESRLDSGKIVGGRFTERPPVLESHEPK